MAQRPTDLVIADEPLRFPGDIARDDSPRHAREPLWAFIERSSLPQVEAHRNDLERWVNEYPAAARRQLLQRLRTPDDHHFRAAYTELFVHAVLRRLTVDVNIDPLTPIGRHTDFRVERWDLDFEVIRPAPADETIARDRRIRDVEDAISKVASPDFALHVNVEVNSVRPPSTKTIRTTLARWLATLDWSQERARLQASHDPPFNSWADPTDGWRIDVSASPRREDRRGIGPTIESRGYDPFAPTSDELLARLLDKREQHRGLGRPLVIVIDITNALLKADEVERALFGPIFHDTTRSLTRQRSNCLWPAVGRSRQPVGVVVIEHLVLGLERNVSMNWYASPGSNTDPIPGPWNTARLSTDGFLIDVQQSAMSLAAILDGAPRATAA